MSYGASSGNKFPDKICEGSGIDVGETVEIFVDRKNDLITWQVGGKRRASEKKHFLGERSRKLFPYVEMLDAGDQIEVMMG